MKLFANPNNKMKTETKKLREEDSEAKTLMDEVDDEKQEEEEELDLKLDVSEIVDRRNAKLKARGREEDM